MGVKKRAYIVYHGTDATNARRILKNGFNAGTYFAIHLEDALGYGGAWVFEVVVPRHLITKGSWQFTLSNGVLPEFIVRLTRYKPAGVKYDNMVLRHLVCISNQSKKETEHIKSDMIVNPSQYSKEELIAYGCKHPHTATVSGAIKEQGNG